MSLFESYERRIDQIVPVLEKYGIKDLEEAKAICNENPFSLSVLKTPAGHTLLVQPLQSRRTVKRQVMLQRQSVRHYRHSVFLEVWQMTEK